MHCSIRFAFAAAAVLLSASTAASADEYVSRSVDVVYGDLDLSTAAGQGALERRIDAATITACGGYPAFHPSYRDAPLFYDKAFARCRAEARHKAIANLNLRGVHVASR